MRWILTFTVLVLLPIAAALPASAAKYSCSAVDSASGMGIPDGATVVIDANRSRRYCGFAVNGVDAGSPPQDEIRDAWNILVRSPQLDVRLSGGDVRWLATVLSTASPEPSVPDELIELLDQNHENLAKCFQVLETQNFGNPDSFGDDDANLFCRPYMGSPDSFHSGAVYLGETATDYLVVRARIGDHDRYLFLPVATYREIRFPWDY